MLNILDYAEKTRDTYFVDEYDVIVIGLGHAGCEAALASARLGSKTLAMCIQLESIALMPCNPAIGGTAKGHLVREIDALGGQMGIAADQACIQFRMLNTSKGPAVHSLRGQADKKYYQKCMLKALEAEPNLDILQCEASKIIHDENFKILGVQNTQGAVYACKSVVIATGVYLNARTITGELVKSSGPAGLDPATKLTESIIEMGIPVMRFKTGTPPRLDSRSIDYDKCDVQPGDEPPIPFSFLTEKLTLDQIPCYLTNTNTNTHTILRDNMNRSPLYSGIIEGTGTRYCPSIEDKVVKFPNRDQHPIFLEPEGRDGLEIYVQGMSSSMPEEVQFKALRTIRGLEHCRIMRTGYAIEYDCIKAEVLNHALMSKDRPGLFFAGQINGTSGYEEAGAQGIIAGINAALWVQNKNEFILDRADGYTGVLIDDLVTKQTPEPYRMMTSRAEYRLVIRQDNADIRLTERSYNIGLASKARLDLLNTKLFHVKHTKELLSSLVVKREVINILSSEYILKLKSEGSVHGTDLIREGLPYTRLLEIYPELPILTVSEESELSAEIRYEGYIKRQLNQVEEMRRLENKKLPKNIDYSEISTLRLEARQKLNAIRPESLGQAARISGVSPSDIQVLLVLLRSKTI